MVEPVTDAVIVKGLEDAAHLGAEAAKSAAESLQTSAVSGGGNGETGLFNYPIEGAQIGMGSSPANFSGVPMPEGTIPDPLGGTQRSIANGAAEKTGAPQESKSLIEKMHDFYKTHKSDIKTIKDKLHTVDRVREGVNKFGKDLMGTDAQRYNPEENIGRQRWGKW